MTYYPAFKTTILRKYRLNAYLLFWSYTISITLLVIAFSSSVNAQDIRSDVDLKTDTIITKTNPLTYSEQRKATAMAAFARLFIKQSEEQAQDTLYTVLKNDPKAKTPLKIALFSLKKASNTDILLQRMITIAEQNPSAMAINLAVIAYLYDEKKIVKAKELADNCLNSNISSTDLSKNNLTIYINIIETRGLIYMKQQDFDNGENFFDTLLKNKYLHHNFTIMKAAVLFFSKGSKHSNRTPFLWFWPSDHERFKQKAADILSLMPNMIKNKQQLAIVAEVYEKLNMPERAENILITDLIKYGKNETIMLMLAKTLTRNKDSRALLYWEALIKINKHRLLYLLQAGNLAWQAGYIDAATNYLQLYLKKRPKDQAVRLRLSMIYMAQGKFDQALFMLKKQPASFYILQGIGTIKLRSGDYHSALASFEQAAKLLPKKQQPLFFCLNMLIAADYSSNVEMVKKYTTIIEHNFPKKVADYGNALGYTLANNNIKLKLAEKLLQQALKRTPARMEVLDSMAWLLYRKKHYSKALHYIKLSLQASGKYPHAVIADHAGDIYSALNQQAKALKYWKIALRTFSIELDRVAVINKIKRPVNVTK